MARARLIKPALFKNEILGVADPILSLLFAGLWCLADREGRLEDRPLRIKAELFPYRDIPQPLFNGYLTDMQRLGFIRRYVVDNLAVIQVLNFTKHQAPHNTEKKSELPEEPPESLANTRFQEITVNSPLNNGEVTEQERPLYLNPYTLSLNPCTDTPTHTQKQKNAKTKKNEKFDTKKFLSEKNADAKLIDDWLAVRKLKKLANTETALNGFLVQVEKSGLTINEVLQKCCEKSWGGFKAEWLENEAGQQIGKRQESVYEKKLRENMEWNERLDRAIGVKKNEIIDIN